MKCSECGAEIEEGKQALNDSFSAQILMEQRENARLRATLALAEKALTLRGPGWPLDEVRRVLGKV